MIQSLITLFNYIKLPKELHHLRRDNECLKWSIARCLNHNTHQELEKLSKILLKSFIQSKLNKDIHKIEKKNSITITVFGDENKEKHQIYVSKEFYEAKLVYLLSRGEEGKRHYVFIQSFYTFMYDHTLNCGKKHSCYCLQAFGTEEILKPHIKDCFKVNGQQRIIIRKIGAYVKFKNYEKILKSPFIIHADFESILVLQDK